MATSEELREHMHHFMHLMRVSGDEQQGRDAFSGQGRVLKLLALNNPVAQKELAYVLGIRSQSLAELLTKMETKGLVSREPNPADRRTSIVSLTADGQAAARELDQDARGEKDPFSVLDDEERGALDRLLRKLIAGVETQMSPAEFPPAPLRWPPPPPPGKQWGPAPPPPGAGPIR